METEEWKQIEINNEFWDYEVSTHGRIRNLKGQILKLSNEKGYLKITLHKNKRMKTCRVHRLVAFAFIENDNPQEKTEVNHIDENKHNNHVDNLEWVTPKENINHGTTQNRRINKIAQKIKCVETGQIFKSINECAREMNLDVGSIYRCLKGEFKQTGGYSFIKVE